jgi:hypothetical protein
VVIDRTAAAAWAARRRADRLEHLAETTPERLGCRDPAPEQNQLRERAGHADQRATVAERVAAHRRGQS